MDTEFSDGLHLIFLHGKPGIGKLTTSKELIKYLPKYKLFHNHLVIDPILKLFDYPSQPMIILQKYLKKH